MSGGSYKVLRSLLELAPSLKWLEVDKEEKKQGEHDVLEQDMMLKEDDEHNGTIGSQLGKKVRCRQQFFPELEAFILSRPFALATESLFRFKKDFFPNLTLLGPMENWNGHINRGIFDRFNQQHPDVKLIYQNKVYLPAQRLSGSSRLAEDKFNPWKYKYVNDVSCCRPSKKAAAAAPVQLKCLSLIHI